MMTSIPMNLIYVSRRPEAAENSLVLHAGTYGDPARIIGWPASAGNDVAGTTALNETRIELLAVDVAGIFVAKFQREVARLSRLERSFQARTMPAC